MTTWLPTDALEDLPAPLQDGVTASERPQADPIAKCGREIAAGLVDRTVSIVTSLTTFIAGVAVVMAAVGLVLRVAQQAGLLRSLLG